MSHKVEAGCRYTQSHEWVKVVENGQFKMGITDYAQSSLGDITYCELPTAGKTFKAGEPMGFVESVKAVSDIVAPVDLEIQSVNETLVDCPETLNQSPYQDGWLIAFKVNNEDQMSALMDERAYEEYLSKES